LFELMSASSDQHEPVIDNRRFSRLFLPLIKLLIGALLIALLFRRQDIRWADLSETVTHLSAQPVWLAATLLLVPACLLCGAERWWTALAGLRVTITRTRAVALFMVGHFFNGFLPGSTGGDVARAFYVARETQGQRTLAVMSIVVERLAGIAVLLILTLTGLLASAERCHLPLLLALVGGLAAAILIVLIKLPSPSRIAGWPLVGKVARHPRIGPVAQRLYAALRLCHAQPLLILRLLEWSLLQHLCAIASWLTLAWGLGFDFRVSTFLLLVPAVLTAQMIPVTPGGLGVREGAAVTLLPAAGMAPHEAMLLSLASFAASLVWSAVGGLVFVLLKERRHHP
jgi:hypothetical protein